MTVEINVRTVRDHLYLQTGASREGPRSNLLLGSLFHEVAAKLCGSRSDLHVVDIVKEHGDSRRAPLLRITYERIVGPRLAAAQAQLAAASREVLHFWSGLQELLVWLSSLAAIGSDKELFASEQPVSARFREPGWTDEVEVSGILDLVLRVPDSRWCLVELKLGKGAPEADLAQACLYHLLLSEAGRTNDSLALVAFGKEKTERMLAADDVARLRRPLLDLIGKLAGVVPEQSRAAPASQLIAKKLTQAFREYGVELQLKQPTLGPAFLRFPVELGRGQSIKRMSSNLENVQVRVGLEAPPMVIVEEGRVVLDVERPDRQVVRFASVQEQITEAKPQASPLLPVGIDHQGTMRFADLSDPLNCHLLVAGTTGSGKSEWLRFALAGIALRSSPEQVKFVLIDPKRNTFEELADSPYLHEEHGLVFPGEHSVQDVLHELAEEMDGRYALDPDRARALPRILVVCDEYYDLVAGGNREQKAIEAGIGRLGAKARAAGIHLILATQHPSRQVLRGAIQANIPCRVALRAQNAIESRMILGESGAEALLGHGDLLFRDVGRPVRLQAPLTSPEERRAIFNVAS